MSKTRNQIEKELNEDIPREAVSQRRGSGTQPLNYLESWYVINRLNEVFGSLGWDSETTEMVPVNAPEGLPAYRAKVRLTVSAPVTEPDGSIVGFRNVVKEGTGWGSDKSKTNPHELAAKEAESDALKRAAMKLGISMGLGLYDKSGEFIADPEPPQKIIDPTPKVERTRLNSQITANSKVVVDKGFRTVEQLKSLMKEKYGVDNKEALTDLQANELLKTLKEIAVHGA